MHTDPNKSVIGNNDFLEEGKENKDLIDFEVNTFGMQLTTKKKISEEVKKMTIKHF